MIQDPTDKTLGAKSSILEMALSGAELPERQLNDAIQRCDWRHAIQLIERQEKKLKKEESADWLAVLTNDWLLHDSAADTSAYVGCESFYSTFAARGLQAAARARSAGVFI